MQYRDIVLTDDIKESLPIRVTEVLTGHHYIIQNRHTAGFEDIKFARFLTYKEMIAEEMPIDFIEKIVPAEERNNENCCMYLVSEGVFTQDVIEALIMRMKYQYSWFKNGFYADGIEALEKAKLQYELFTEIRQKYGFYHIPFTIEKFIEAIEQKSEFEVAEDRQLIDTFLELDPNDMWRTRQELIEKILAIHSIKEMVE